MLVLSRKPNERIVIGDGIVVTVVAINAQTVRLGIEAPNDIAVYRGELRDSLQSRITGDFYGQEGSTTRVKTFSRVASAPGSGRRPDLYTGWGVIYTTPDVANPFVQRVLMELRERYKGLRAFAEYDPQEQTVTIEPPEDDDFVEANRLGDEIEELIMAIYEKMSRQNDRE
jgi:carbon storage regulator